MQLTSETRTVESNLHGQTSAFTITANAQAFKVLSSNLYSNRPLAIVREICSNAWDAHRRAGIPDTPIEVRTPSLRSHNLTIRDFGPGLSHNSMITLYTSMFGTDKGHSNDEIGGLGLGSKSPLSYTDQFTVISYHNGTKNTYSAYLDSSGMPQITRLDQQPTSETGLEVIVPSNANGDSHRFLDEAEKFLPQAREPAKLNGEPVNQEEPILQWQLQGFPELTIKLYPNRRRGLHMPFAQMGPVRYGMWDYRLKNISTYRVTAVIEMPIGHIDIAPSRETLSPTKKQHSYLTQVCETISQAIQDDDNFNRAVTEKLDEARSPYEAYEIMSSLEQISWVVHRSRGVKASRNVFLDAGGTSTPYWEDPRIMWYGPSTRKNAKVAQTPYYHGNDFAIITNPEGKRAYKHHVQKLLETVSKVALFKGTVEEAKQWIKSVGFPPGKCEAIEELSAPPKKEKGPKGVYGPTEYECLYGNVLRSTAQQIAALAANPENVVFLFTQSTPAVNYYSYLHSIANKRICIFNIPRNHTKVINGLVEDGCHLDVASATKALELPSHLAAIARAGGAGKISEPTLDTLTVVGNTGAHSPSRLEQLSECTAALMYSINQLRVIRRLLLMSATNQQEGNTEDIKEATEECNRVLKQTSYWGHYVGNYYGCNRKSQPCTNMSQMMRMCEHIVTNLYSTPVYALEKISELHEECNND